MSNGISPFLLLVLLSPVCKRVLKGQIDVWKTHLHHLSSYVPPAEVHVHLSLAGQAGLGVHLHISHISRSAECLQGYDIRFYHI